MWLYGDLGFLKNQYEYLYLWTIIIFQFMGLYGDRGHQIINMLQQSQYFNLWDHT